MPAASPTHGAVSRGQGSAMTLEGGSSGSWARVASAWSAPVMIMMRSGGTRCSIRATVCWSIVDSPVRLEQLLGPVAPALGPESGPAAARHDNCM